MNKLSLETTCRICNNKTSIIGEKNGYSFARCDVCQYVFCPEITSKYLMDLYASGFHGPDDGAPEGGWCKLETLDPVLQLMDKSQTRVLDFGAGQSIIPHQLRKQYGLKVTAVDLIPPVQKHPDHITGDILDLDLAEGSFDLVYSLQVLEHIPDPVPLVNKLFQLVTPGGFLYIHTDMETAEREKNFFEWEYAAPPDHCSYYKPDTFDFILSEKNKEFIKKAPKYVLIKSSRSILTDRI